VTIEAGIAAAALWAFGVHVFTSHGALVDRRMLGDRNVMTGFLFIALVGLLLTGTTALVPTMMQTLFGYPVIETGMLQMPRGVGMMLAMMLAGQLIGRVDSRGIIGCGMGLASVSMYLMSLFSPEMDATPFMVTGFLQGAGLGLIFVPLNTLAFATLAADLRTDAAGFYMLLRNLGGSVGISLAVGVLARQGQVSHADIGAALTPAAMPWADGAIGKALGSDAVIAMLDATVNRQAAMIAYIDVFRMLFWVTVAMLPLVLVLRKPRVAGPAVHLAD
jgi:MFS transporter, DHA2 family, multidrug resistance protein